MDIKSRLQVAQLRLGLGNFSIYEGVNTVGRNKDAIVNIKNLNISQHHAIIMVLDGEHYISDLNSSNGSFCEGTKMIPFKIYKLKNRIEITLGGLTGIYVTNAAFFEENIHPHSTTLVSQSLYGCNTQMLEISAENSIHDVATQEISWTNIKPNNIMKNNLNDDFNDEYLPCLEHNSDKIFDEPEIEEKDNNKKSIFEEQTELFDLRKSSLNNDKITESNATTNQQGDNAETSKNQKSIFDEQTQVYDLKKTLRDSIHNNKISESNSTTNNSQKLNNAKNEEAKIIEVDKLTDSENDKDNVETANDKEFTADKGNEMTYCEKDNNQAATSTENFVKENKKTVEEEDDEMTDCEDDKIESRKDKKEFKTTSEDDEMTDCEEDLLPSNPQKHDNKELKKRNSIPDDDEMTDCEDDIKVHSAKNKNELKITFEDDEVTDCESNEENQEIENDGSENSVEFLRFDNSSANNKSEESSVFLGFDQSLLTNKLVTSKQNITQNNQNTDDEPVAGFTSKKKKKSSMVLSTQDFNEDSQQEDNSYLEHQSKKSTIDDDQEIPATQMLDESDYVAATQQFIKRPEVNESQNKNEMSEESFKLGLTELMTEDMDTQKRTSNDKSIQDIFDSSNHNTELDLFDTSRQQINIGISTKNTLKEISGTKINLEDSSKAVITNKSNLDDIDTFGAPTQKLAPSESNRANLDDTDSFGAPTQKFTASKSNEANLKDSSKGVDINKSNLDDTDIFEAPTQKLAPSESNKANLDDTDFFGAPTQKFAASKSNKANLKDFSKGVDMNKSNLDDTDIFGAPTQKLAPSESNKANLDDTDSFGAPTQKFTASKSNEANLKDSSKGVDINKSNLDDTDIFGAPTQKLAPSESNKANLDDTDFFGAPTQKFAASKSNEANLKDFSKGVDMNKSNLDDTDIFGAPTQKLAPSESNKANLGDTDFFGAPTQKIVIAYTKRKSSEKDICKTPTKKIEPSESKKNNLNETDIFEAPTQKTETIISQKDKEINPEADLDIFDAPTQQNEIFLTPIQKLTITDLKEEKSYFFEKTPAIYEAPTQKIGLEQMDPSKFEESTDIFDVATQKMSMNEQKLEYDNLLAHTRNIKLNISKTSDKKKHSKADIKNKDGDITQVTSKSQKKLNYGDPVENLKNSSQKDKKKKTFSFKKSNLDATISDLAETKTSKETDLGQNNKTVMINASVSDLDETKQNHEPNNIKENKIKKLTIKKNSSTKNNTERSSSNPLFNELSSIISEKRKNGKLSKTEELAPKFVASEDDSSDGPSFNASNSKSLALFESKMHKTKKKIDTLGEIKVTVLKNKRCTSITTVEEVELDKKASKKTQEVPAKEAMIDNNVSSVSGRKIRSTRKMEDLETERKSSKRNKKGAADGSTFEETTEEILKASTKSALNNRLSTVSEENLLPSNSGGRNGKATATASRRTARKNNLVEETNNNEDSKKSRSTKAKKRQSDGNNSTEDCPSPSKRQKLQLIPDSPGTALKNLRKQKPKVVFTMMESPKLESLIKQLGGSVVDSVESCTVLVTETVKRTSKLLTAIGLGKPICSPKWITDSKKAQEFLDPWDYILTDPETEKKWNFSLKESLTRSQDLQLLKSYSFFIQVTNGLDVLKGAIESCGGKVLPKIPSTLSEGTYIISCPENRSKYSRLLKKNPDLKIIEAEAVFDGVLRQELRFNRHMLT